MPGIPSCVVLFISWPPSTPKGILQTRRLPSLFIGCSRRRSRSYRCVVASRRRQHEKLSRLPIVVQDCLPASQDGHCSCVMCGGQQQSLHEKACVPCGTQAEPARSASILVLFILPDQRRIDRALSRHLIARQVFIIGRDLIDHLPVRQDLHDAVRRRLDDLMVAG